MLKICERKCFREFHEGVRVEEGFKVGEIRFSMTRGKSENFRSNTNFLKRYFYFILLFSMF